MATVGLYFRVPNYKILFTLQILLRREKKQKVSFEVPSFNSFFPSVFFFDRSSYPSFLKKQVHVHILLYERKREPCSFDEAFTLPSSSLGMSWLLSAQKLEERESNPQDLH
jgi:hypothetical protein